VLTPLSPATLLLQRRKSIDSLEGVIRLSEGKHFMTSKVVYWKKVRPPLCFSNLCPLFTYKHKHPRSVQTIVFTPSFARRTRIQWLHFDSCLSFPKCYHLRIQKYFARSRANSTHLRYGFFDLSSF
jgi:hypothetical protein